METPVSKLAIAAESGIITSSPELWKEWKRTMEERFAMEIKWAYRAGQKYSEVSEEQYFESNFGKPNDIPTI